MANENLIAQLAAAAKNKAVDTGSSLLRAARNTDLAYALGLDAPGMQMTPGAQSSQAYQDMLTRQNFRQRQGQLMGEQARRRAAADALEAAYQKRLRTDDIIASGSPTHMYVAEEKAGLR